MRSSFLVSVALLAVASGAGFLVPQAHADTIAATEGTSSSSNVASVVDLIASTPPAAPVFFQMADGRWYDPHTGYTAISQQALRDLINPPPAPAAPPRSDPNTPTPTPAPVFFQMANGQWYDPHTGLSAASEQALRDLINPPAVPGTSTGAVSLQEFPLIQAIHQGQAMLRENLPQSDTLLSSRPEWAPVRLAVWRSASNQMDLIDIEKRGTEIRGNDPHIAEVNVLLSRQLQSQYSLASEGDVVVAIRYPLYREEKVGKKTKYRREDVVYSPYSPLLHTDEMVRFGQAWLDQQFQRIADDLRTRGIRSRFDPSKSLADMLSADVARAILVIEHTDETSLEQDAAKTYSRMLVTVAANATTSYAYSDSNVGAQGFAQFMPATYKLVAKDDSLGLPKDVQTGTRQFETAIKAELVYLDRLWSVMPDQAKTLFTTDPDRAAEYIVAAYNGGEVRVQRAAAYWGEDWATPDTSTLKKAKTLVSNATAEVKKAKKAVTAAKTKKAKTAAKAKLNSAETALANAEAKLAKIDVATLRDETIGYVAKFRNALKGIRTVRANLNGSTVAVTTSTLSSNSTATSQQL